ncbi:hypothetical protein [Paenibacillus sp. Soil787]|uniref:hypothetical protein n=1 Tax=Paenibacillus sp. Soil787 TaxID=1736411 RepID=UPI0007025CD0|nr:hypothetical protein [Paenibacillus sp. Soil787]KRF21502.1 ABC transporter substrate-binding protein [Paenibacillus sp. Soil787]
MNRTWNKKVSIVMSTALAISVLAACSSNKPAVTSSTTPSASQTDAAKQAPLVMDWLGYNSYGQPDPESYVVKYVQDKFNVKFNFWYIDNQKWDDNLNVKLAAGEMPDVLRIANKANIARYVTQGILAPISEDTFRKFAPNYAKFLDTYYKEAWDGVKYDGKIYAIPTTNLNASYPTDVIWREDWLKNVGITKVPETLQEYETALYKFRDEDPDKNGKKDTNGLSDYALPNILGAFGYPGIMNFKDAAKGVSAKAIPFTLKDGKVVFAPIQPEMKDALALLQKWYKDGIISPEFVTGENTGGYWADSQAFYNGKIGLTGISMFYHWRNELNPDNPADKGGGQWVAFKQAQPNGTIAFGKPAVGPKGKSGVEQWDTSSPPVGITTKAAKDPKKLETLLKMIDLSVTDNEYFNTISYGAPGVDWKMENGKFTYMTITDTAADATKKGKGVLGALVQFDPFLKKADPFTYQYGDKVIDKTKGYKPLFVPTTDAFTKNSATLSKLTAETYFKIITGEASLDSFDDYVKKFKANGGDEVEKAANDAYNKMIGK